ncbi:Hypothetical predicted protein [Lecanosticta acicola]|uniref:Uncharacterized protein n=1 Tax=Lecanosticta acicola TaxID=111012 RepID=A0AAI8Z035_9PEZI|nr:Hypothetical predicted protein [Lecanosticta acicola]
MRALDALLAVWSCLLCQTAISQSTTSTAVTIGDDGPESGGIVPIPAPSGATGDSPFPTSGGESGFTLDVPQPTDLPDASSTQKFKWIHPTVTPSPVTVPKHNGSHMQTYQTYQARRIGGQTLVSAHSTWAAVHSVYLDFLPNPFQEPKSVYTEVKVIGKSSTVVVEPTATVVTVDGHVFPVVHTDGPSPIPSDLIHTVEVPQFGSAIMVPAPAQATQESLVSALLVDPESRLAVSDGDGDGDRSAKKWKRIAIIALAVGGPSWLLLPLLCCCIPLRRREKVVEKTTSTDPATGLTVVTTSTSPASNGTGTTTVETTERGTLTRQAEEGRGRLSQVIGSGARGHDTGVGAGAAAASRGGSEGSSGGSGAGRGASGAGKGGSGTSQGDAGAGRGSGGAGQGSGSASGAGGTGASGLGASSGTSGHSGAAGIDGGSGAAGESSALRGADAKGVATDKKIGAAPASAEHVEAVPAHDGADSLRTGSEMLDIGSLRGRRKMRPDSRSPF